MAELDLTVNVETKGTDKLGSLGQKIGGIAKTAAVGLGIVTGAGTAIGAVLVDAAAEAEKTQAKLQSVFDSTGAAAFTSIDALNEHAEALAKATTFDDDAVKDAQSTLLSFGNITGDAFTQATEASADLAAFMGVDMDQAAKTLGKALAIPEEAAAKLARQGIILTDQQKAQIAAFTEAGDTAAAQGVILDAVGAKFGTVAEDLAATSGGQLTQAMNALGEAGESIGVLLLPVLTAVAQGIKGLADFVVANMPVIQSVIGTVVGFISKLFSGAGGRVSALQQLFAGIVAFVSANLPTISSIAGQVFGAVGNIIKVLAPILIEIAKVLLPAIGTAATIAFKVLDVAFKGIGGAVEVLGNVFDTVFGFIQDLVGGIVGAIKGVYNAFARVWNSIEISVPAVDIPLVGRVGGFSVGLPDLPMLASGGIVNDPTLAIIGEKGPEAVIPLDQMPGSQTIIEVTVLGDLQAEDERSLADAIGRVWWANGFSDQVLSNG